MKGSKRFVRVNPTGAMILNGLIGDGVAINAPAGPYFTNVSYVFSITTDLESPQFDWNLEPGIEIVSGQGTSIATIRFTSGGVRSVRVAVTDQSGTTYRGAWMDHVGEEPLYTASVTPPPGTLYTATNYTFTGSTNVPSPTFTWSVGGGATIVSGQGTSSVVVAFSDSGDRSVTLTVGGGGSASATWTGTVEPWLPTLLPNLALWIDAADASTITLDGSGNVEQWNDKSGNGRNLTQGAVLPRPAYTANVLNGNPVVRSDGIDDIISTDNYPTSTWYGSGTPQITWINVLAYRNTGRLSMRLQRTTANTNRIQIDRQAGDAGGDVAFSVDNSTANITSAPHAGTNWYIETFRWTNGGTPTLRRTSSAGTNTYDANNAVTGTPNDNIAAHVGYGTIAPAQFDLAEHLIYARNLTDTELGQIEAYLLAKWGTI